MSFLHRTATPDIYTLSLHDALPICFLQVRESVPDVAAEGEIGRALRSLLLPRVRASRGAALRRRTPLPRDRPFPLPLRGRDRKSTRLNSSHVEISYAVFCLKKKKIL